MLINTINKYQNIKTSLALNNKHTLTL